MIDTHAHLTDGRIAKDVEEIIKEAKSLGIGKIIVPATDMKDSRKVGTLVEKHRDVFGLVGIYPGFEGDENDLNLALEELKTLVGKDQIVGIGEIGMDSYWNERQLEKEVMVFRSQLELASELNKPVAIHSRGSEKEIGVVLEAMEKLPHGQFHCFGESPEFLEYVLNKGFYVSFCGNVTYKSAHNLRELAVRVPLDRLLLETDSPYLPPEPLRGERNTPINVKITAEFLAELRGESFDQLVKITTKNAKDLFGI